jgi:hypothetical protein
MDPATLSDMLRGDVGPPFGSVQAVCTALGLGLQDVIVFPDDRREKSAG